MSNRAEHFFTVPVRSIKAENEENVRWLSEQYPELEVELQSRFFREKKEMTDSLLQG